jgi:hypothetical protein
VHSVLACVCPVGSRSPVLLHPSVFPSAGFPCCWRSVPVQARRAHRQFYLALISARDFTCLAWFSAVPRDTCCIAGFCLPARIRLLPDFIIGLKLLHPRIDFCSHLVKTSSVLRPESKGNFLFRFSSRESLHRSWIFCLQCVKARRPDFIHEALSLGVQTPVLDLTRTWR